MYNIYYVYVGVIMKMRKILIICLILCCILSLQALGAAEVGNDNTNDTVLTTADSSVVNPDEEVMATDDSNDDILATDDSRVNSNDSYLLSLSDNDDVLGDGEESFTQLQSDISGGGTVTLTKNYTYVDADGDLKKGILITADTNIIGNGHIVIDASNKARVFNIQNGVTVTLKGITFINGNSTGPGGSVLSNGVVHIEDCKFINNTATAGNGGSVFLNCSGSTITGSYFEGSHTTKTTDTNGIGGAVFLSASDIAISHSTFFNNTAGYNGGAIGSRNGIANCIIINCTLENNTADGSAGAIGMQSTNFRIYNSTFKYNKAKGKTNIGNGGGIVLRGSDSYAYNCTFIGNRAFNNGGGSFLTNTTEASTNYNTGFELCTFTDNFAGYNGGAVNWVSGAHEGYVIDSTFNDNLANRSGGAIYWSGHNGTVSNCTFTHNNALGGIHDIVDGITGGGDGGAILWIGSNGIIKGNCIFNNNHAENRGGAIYLHGSSTENCTNITVTNCSFDSNYAGMNGGAIDWNEGSHEGNIYYTTFTNNVAGSNGGAVFWSGHDGEIHYSNFTNNTAKGLFKDTHGNIGDGGAVIWSGINGTVTYCRFVDNVAGQRGGAVYLQNCSHGNCDNTTFSHDYFRNNTAGTNGGAIDWHEGAEEGEVSYSVFEQNTAKRSGGAIYWNGNTGEIKDSNFTANRALGVNNATDAFGVVTYGGDGGAVIWIGSDGIVDNCRFIDNGAAKRGGAVYLQGTAKASCENTTFKNSYFKNNTAGTNGGAIDWNKGAHNGLIDNTQFVENIAYRSGGAVYWNGNEGEIRNSNFTSNKAEGKNNATDAFGNVTYGGDGGAVIWIGSEGTVDNCRFIDNEAAKRGGAVYLQGTSEANCTDTTFKNSYFKDNVAGTNGGAIDWNKGAHNGIVDNVQFINNTANRSGGAIYWNGHNGTIQYSVFYNNTALGNASGTTPSGTVTNGGDGGAIMWTGAIGTVKYSNFVNNTAVKRGGAVFLQGAIDEPCENTSFLHSYFKHNRAGTNGGAVDWSQGAQNGLVDDVTFIENYANGDGGSIYWSGHNGTVQNTKFTNNSAGDDGGAIYWEGDIGKIYNTIFYNNTGVSYNESSSRGGAICLTGHDAVIDKSTFTLCSVRYGNGFNASKLDGGAIFLTGDDVNITNSNFSMCSAYHFGGSIYVVGHNSLFDNCIIEKSSAENGGAVYVEGSNITLADSTVRFNHASEDGGALYVFGDGGQLYDTTFNNNFAGDDGGAIYWEGSEGKIRNITCDINAATGANGNSKGGTICLTGSNVSISESKFNRSSAIVDGGVIFLTGNNVNITDSTFTYANVTNNGGSIYALGNFSLIKNCEFERSNALNGGMIYIEGHDVIMDNVISIFNLARNDGGAIYVLGNRAVIINSDLEYTNATNYGGAIYGAGDLMRIDNSKFTRCIADNHDGGALYIAGLNSTISNSEFNQNKVNQDNGRGGSINVQGNNTNIFSCTFDQCNGYEGGVIYINGSHVTIDGYSCNRSLATNHGGAIYVLGNNATIKNFNISLTNATGHGGAIYVAGNDAQIYNSNFTRCISYRGDGGALYVAGANAVISNSKFEQNRVVGATARGGSILIQGHDANLTNCEFMFCSAYEGGVLYVEGDNITADKLSSKFSSSNTGGSIYIKGNSATISNSDIMFSNATEDGGAMYIAGDFSVIDNTLFAMSNANRGGGIFFNGRYGNVSGSTFNNNVAIFGSGGAIYWSGAPSANSIEKSSFNHNLANYSGGAIYWANGGNGGFVKDSTFTNNIANSNEQAIAGGGGAIYWTGNINGYLDNCIFINNTALFLKGGDAGQHYSGAGGALFWRGINGTVKNSYFENNTAYARHNFYGGGAIMWHEAEGGNIFNVIFVNNNAETSGGAVDVFHSSNLVINRSYSYYNTAKKGGSIWLEKSVNVDFLNSIFENNTASGDGGAIFFNVGGDKSYFENCTFTNNDANESGAIWFQTKDSIINSSYFYDNHCGIGTGSLRAGAVYSSGDNNIITDCIFENNYGSIAGAIYWDSKYGIINNTLFKNNSAYQAGVIYTLQPYSGIYNSVFDSNKALNSLGADKYGEGGAVYWYQKYWGTYGKIVNCNFTNNYADATGGAIRWGKSDGYLANLMFVNNSAGIVNNGDQKRGGSLYSDGDARNAQLINITIKDSSSYAEGGAIYWTGSGSTFENISVENSYSVNSRGTIYISNANIKLYNAKINDVHAKGSGGAIYWNGASGELINVSISNTYSNGDGGAIYLSGDAQNAVLTNVSVDKASANNGGGIYIQAPNTRISGSSITNSVATNNGGGIYWKATGGTLEYTNIEGNTAKFGAGLYIDGNSLTINYSNFTYNIAQRGSAIYSTSAFTISNSKLIKNRANSASLDISIESTNREVTITFKGWDNLLNAIYMTSTGNAITADNVTYWSALGINNTGSQSLKATTTNSNLESGQNITIEIYDQNNNKIYYGNDVLTNLNGQITIAIPQTRSSNSLGASRKPNLLGASNEIDGISVKAFLTNEDYYTYIENAKGKKLSNINASADNISYHENNTIEVNVTVGATGIVSVYINGTFYDNITLQNSKGSLKDVSYIKWDKYLPAGNYTIFAKYWGDDEYLPSNITSTFSVAKITPDIIIDIDDRGYDLYIDLTVKSDDLLDANGTVTLDVDDRIINVTIVNGKGFVIVKEIAVGNYTIQANYSGDNNYNKNVNSTLFKMKAKYPSSIDLEVHDIMINETECINVTVNTNATGEVTIYVNGKPYTVALNESRAQLNVTGLPKGTNYVLVIYDGDKNNTGCRAEDTFTVSKYVPTININATNITHGSTETLNITVPDDATGIVKVLINGSDYYGEIRNGSVIVNVSDLKVGKYNVTVFFEEDDKYLSAQNTTTFEVTKAAAPININVDNVTYGNETVIVVTLPDDATGNITINVNNTIIKNVTVVNGTAILNVGILAVDNYTVNVTYAGDENHTGTNATQDFKVIKATPVITVDNVTIPADSNATITIHITDGTTGNVTVTVDGQDYEAEIHDGVVIITTNKLLINSTVTVTYDGDGNFTNATGNGLVNVVKVVPKMNITTLNITTIENETITVNVPIDATGNVTIWVNNKNYTNVTNNGKAVFTIPTLPEGTYTVNATLVNDTKYVETTVDGLFRVDKLQTPINVTVKDAYVGDNVTVIVSVPKGATGNITIEINGQNYTAKIDENGNATFKVLDVTYGNKTIAADYIGDANYLANHTTGQFKVIKRNSTVKVNTTAINVGETAVINVTIPDNATGYVIVSVNGTNYTVNTTNGFGSVKIVGLTNGTYNINVTYIGDDQYVPSINSTTLNVLKVNSTVSVKADNITVGQKAIVEITVPNDATGNVTIKLDGKNYNVSVSQGKGVLVVPGLKVGNYTINVTYVGDNRYKSSTNSTTFKVSKVNTTDIDVVDQGNGTVVVIIGDNATGNVTIVLENGTNFTAPVINGTAIVNLTNVTPGEQNVTVIYSGDENHTNITKNATVNIPKLTPAIKVNVTDIYVGDVALINVTLPGDASGNVTVEINGKTYKPVEFVGGVARFKVENLTFGNKTVAVKYSGDSNYTDISTTANFTVKKRISQVNVTVNATTVGKDTIINVTIPDNATGYVVVNVDGRNYTINTTNAAGSIAIKGLGNITHNVTVTYLGDEQYLPSTNKTNFTLSKVDSFVIVKAENITVGDKLIVEITTPSDMMGNVTVQIGNKNYTTYTSNGQSWLIIPNLKVGNYTINVTYNENGKYKSSINFTNVEVRKINISETDIKVIDQGNGTVVVIVPGNATGNVTIEVGNHTYNATVINGTAIVYINNETPGEHNITVIYSGDSTHTNATTNGTVMIPKYDTPIIVNVTEIIEGEVAVINVTVPVNATGNVTVTIDGKKYPGVIVTAIVKVDNLTAGNKTVVVEYLGDDNYVANYTVGNFTVKEAKVVPDIHVVDQGNGTVVVIVGDNATGNVTIKVGNNTYNATVVNGTAVVYINNETPGEHNITVIYSGDDTHTNATANATATIPKYDTPITVNVTEIYNNGTAVLKVTVPVNATGNVTVTIDGKKYPGVIVNGTAIVKVDNLTAGNKTVVVEYPGDDNYINNYTVSNFTVNTVVTTPDIIVADQGNGTVMVIVGGNATGNVTITIENGTNFTAPVINGVAIVNLTNVTPGIHEIEVIYSGDGNYTAANTTANVTIPKLTPTIKVDVTNIYVGDKALINVTLPKDATGSVTIEINGKVYTPVEFVDGVKT